MKYLLVLVLFLAAWTVIRWFFFEDRGAGEPATFRDKIRDLGRNLHTSVGIAAIILIIIIVARLLYQALFSN